MTMPSIKDIPSHRHIQFCRYQSQLQDLVDVDLRRSSVLLLVVDEAAIVDETLVLTTTFVVSQESTLELKP